MRGGASAAGGRGASSTSGGGGYKHYKKKVTPELTATMKNFMYDADDANKEQVEVNSHIMDLIALMKELETAALPERKKFFRKKCLEWHPDKHPDSENKKFIATCVFQFLQEKKDWFLRET